MTILWHLIQGTGASTDCDTRGDCWHQACTDIEGQQHITLYRKGVFADVIELKILKWGDYPGLSECDLSTIRNVLSSHHCDLHLLPS